MFDLANLRYLLKHGGYTYDQMAEKTGISRITILRIANGKSNNPQWETVEKILQVYRNER